MKIEEVKPAIRQFKYRQEKTDPDYGTCMWATFNLDTESYTLYIESDCGNYAYGWTPTPDHESFIRLMSRIDEGYLLGKIANADQFNFEVSKEKTIANIREYFEYDIYLEEIMEEIEYRICFTGSEHDFFDNFDDLLNGYSVSDTFEIIHTEMEYSAGAKRIAKIFCEVLQPILKEECRKEKTP